MAVKWGPGQTWRTLKMRELKMLTDVVKSSAGTVVEILFRMHSRANLQHDHAQRVDVHPGLASRLGWGRKSEAIQKGAHTKTVHAFETPLPPRPKVASVVVRHSCGALRVTSPNITT